MFEPIYKCKINLIVVILIIFLAQQGYCGEPSPKEKRNPLIGISKIIGGALIIFGGTSMIILADSPKCDDESPVLGPCTKGEPHPTRDKIAGSTLVVGGACLATVGIINLVDTIKNDDRTMEP